MWQLPGKNIAFVFSDTAGGNACMALAKMCKENFNIKPLFFTNRNYSGDDLENLTITKTEPSFKSLGLDCVFTGTSHPSSSEHFEVNCIRRAVHEKIYTISFIDHWVNFRLRFNGLKELEYPDEIWVVDEIAKQLAIAEGLPEEKIVVKTNPYHYYLKNQWRSKYSGKNYLSNFNIPLTGCHILFTPDPLSIRNAKGTVGFTEEEALIDLLQSTKEWENEMHLIVKCHPLQPMENLRQIVEESKTQNIFLIKEADTLELIHSSDIVIGFYSNALLDAHALGKKVIRYFPGNDEADLLKHKMELKKAHTMNELADELKSYTHG